MCSITLVVACSTLGVELLWSAKRSIEMPQGHTFFVVVHFFEPPFSMQVMYVMYLHKPRRRCATRTTHIS